jgi:Holliday junction resolvase RusA-like endonuclease
MMELRYTVPGRPCTWVRRGLRGNQTYTPAAQRKAKAAHVFAAMAAFKGQRAAWMLTGAFGVGVVAHYESAVVGDCDRLVSLAMDALEGLAYITDRQVRVISGHVVADSSEPRVMVHVWRLPYDPVRPKTPAKRKARRVAA